MVSNKSNAMAVICVTLFFFAHLNAPGNEEFTEAHLAVGSAAHQCYNGIKYFCAVSPNRYVSKKDCLREGIRGYPRNANPPNYVTAYFGMFRTYMDPSTCLLPEPYCQFETNARFPDESEERNKDCMDDLKIFNDLVETPQEDLDDVHEMELLVAELEQKSRYKVLHYMFYDIIAIERDGIMIDDYCDHMFNCVIVSLDMPEPINYCMLNYSNNVG